MTTRLAPVVTLVVGAASGELYLLRHSAGEGAEAFVERIDPETLECLSSSGPLPGGPVWPGGIGVHGDGSLHVVFGNHAHRLSPALSVLASARLPQDRPYNSFVTLASGHIATKDFGSESPAELLVLDPQSLDVAASVRLPEASIARLSADDESIFVVGVTALWRVPWSGAALGSPELVARYRTMEGQTYGWDCVLAGGFAWFLDNGEGAAAFSGTLRGHGVSTAPLHLVRVALADGATATVEICGEPGGLVANPPVVDVDRDVVVGYDSGNGVVVGFDVDTLEPRWRRDQDHASHLLLYEATGELVTGDASDVVVLDVATGEELARADSGAGIQSVLFPAPGFDRDFYVTTLMSVSRVAVSP